MFTEHCLLFLPYPRFQRIVHSNPAGAQTHAAFHKLSDAFAFHLQIVPEAEQILKARQLFSIRFGLGVGGVNTMVDIQGVLEFLDCDPCGVHVFFSQTLRLLDDPRNPPNRTVEDSLEPDGIRHGKGQSQARRNTEQSSQIDIRGGLYKPSLGLASDGTQIGLQLPKRLSVTCLPKPKEPLLSSDVPKGAGCAKQGPDVVPRLFRPYRGPGFPQCPCQNGQAAQVDTQIMQRLGIACLYRGTVVSAAPLNVFGV